MSDRLFKTSKSDQRESPNEKKAIVPFEMAQIESKTMTQLPVTRFNERFAFVITHASPAISARLVVH